MLLCAASTASADTPLDDGGVNRAENTVAAGKSIGVLDRPVATADLVFYGRVTGVEHRTASTPTEVRYPLTYVRFSVDAVLQGRYSEPELTLMLPGVGFFPGGDRFSLSDYLPILSPGDELVMFLAKGNANGPRYVDHLFVLDDKLYDPDSHALVKSGDGRIQRGAFTGHRSILERSFGQGVTITTHHPEAEEPTPQSAMQADDPRDQLTLDDFSGELADYTGRTQSHQSETIADAARGVSIKSADSDRPLFFEPFQGLREE